MESTSDGIVEPPNAIPPEKLPSRSKEITGKPGVSKINSSRLEQGRGGSLEVYKHRKQRSTIVTDGLVKNNYDREDNIFAWDVNELWKEDEGTEIRNGETKAENWSCNSG